jgi:ATP-dependent Clp protease ATP-binding subunit ClpA
MDILDKVTNKEALLQALEERKKKNQTVNAEELAAAIKEFVIGQDKVADEVAAQIRRRLAMKQRGKPIGVFCFAGPPGVGKTYFAKILAEKLYGSKKALQHFDLAQYGQAHAAATLFGQAKGYVGSDSYGLLTASLRDFPKSVILLDEFEKADAEVHKRFLTAWNDGFIIEASDGRQISTTEAIFILTTNAAADRIGELAARFADDRDALNTAAKGALRDANFAPEVLSRIDHVFSFARLQGADIARVVSLEITALLEQYDLQLAPGGIDMEILLDAMDRAEAAGHQNVREIARSIEKEMGDSLVDAKLAGKKIIRISSVDGRILAIPVP